jgi:hypothetical protein
VNRGERNLSSIELKPAESSVLPVELPSLVDRDRVAIVLLDVLMD